MRPTSVQVHSVPATEGAEYIIILHCLSVKTFCESGYINPGYYDRDAINQLHYNDTLWDGEDCHHTSTCCSLHNPPYFTKTLSDITDDDLEVRSCTFGSPVAIELVELP